MTMNIDDPARLNGTPVIGGDGEKLGSVDSVYYDNATDRPEWVAVRSGLFGTRVALVPLRRANYGGDILRVPFDKVQLRNAPHHDPGRELSSSDEADLYRYYGIDYTQFADDSVTTSEFATGTLRDRDGNDRTRQTARADHADETRSADVSAGTVSPEQDAGPDEIGQARLRRHAAESAQTMPMSREEMHGSDPTRVEPDLDIDPGLRERRSL